MLNKRKLYWTLQLSGWFLYALLQAGFYVVASAQGVGVKRILFFSAEALLCLFVTHGLRYMLVRWRSPRMSIWKLVPRVLLAIIFSSFLIYFLRIPVSLFLGLYFDWTTAVQPGQILGLSSFYAFLLLIWVMVYFTYHYIEQYNRALKNEALVASVELNNLKTQLNPHLIFNALNSIRALVDENPSKSKDAINQLSGILRNSLSSDKKALTKFEDELRMVNDYLGLESIRFEERLSVTFDIHPDSNKFLVPPFMIQTLVENGIKHGISQRKEGGLIEIKTSVHQNRLKIRIRNSGHYVNGSKRDSGGVGIKNTVQRLRLIYGNRASLRISNEKDNFVVAEVTVPKINTK